MTKIDLQYDLINYTPASASPVEANFDRAEQHINQELIERDGTVAMRAQLKLVGDPVAELDAAPKQYVDQVLPIGIVMMFGGSSVPPGGRWAICNGAELQTATYPALYAVIGTNFGGASGRFNLPNLVDRFPMGNGGLAALGATGGNRDATLPAHAHAGGTHSHGLGGHYHGVNGGTGTDGPDHSHGNTSDVSNHHTHAVNWGEVWHSSAGPIDNVNIFGVRVGDGITIIMEKFNSSAFPTAMAGNHVHGTEGANARHSHALSVNTGGPSGGSDAAYSGDTDSRGSAATNANLPPYVGMAYIMRVL